MQIPVPEFTPIATALLLALIVLVCRWLLFSLVYLLGGGGRLAAFATINLAQISEFALVICSLGIEHNHIDVETLTIVIWTFIILSVLSAKVIGFKGNMYRFAHRCFRRVRGRFTTIQEETSGAEDSHDRHRDIVLLGFGKIASLFVAQMELHSPLLLRRLHVVSFNQQVKAPLERRDVGFSYGDISSPDVLEHAFHGKPALVLSTSPDSALQNSTNAQILNVAKKVWPDSSVVVTAQDPTQATELYRQGADYVLRSASLCADRLYELVSKHGRAGMSSELEALFEQYRQGEEKQGTLRKKSFFV